MFRQDVVKGTADVSVMIYVIDNSDGTPETGWDHSTSGIDLWYRREGGAEVSITEAALAAWNSAHTDGGVEHGSNGRGRLDLPDAACEVGTDGATYCEYGGTITGMIVIGGHVQLTDPINDAFEAVTIGSTGNDTSHVHIPTWTYGDDEINNFGYAFHDVSEDEWFFGFFTDWVNSTKLATITPALPVTPADASDRIALTSGTRATIALEATLGTPADTDIATDIANAQTELDAIGPAIQLIETTIATLASQIQFTLTEGSTDDDAYNGCMVIVQDASTEVQIAVGFVQDYTGATKTVDLHVDPGVFTMAVTDSVRIIANQSHVQAIAEAFLTGDGGGTPLDAD